MRYKWFIVVQQILHKKLVWISLNQCHGLQKTGPKWFSLVPSISGLVLDWLQATIAHFWGNKTDQTKPVNTSCDENDNIMNVGFDISRAKAEGSIINPPLPLPSKDSDWILLTYLCTEKSNHLSAPYSRLTTRFQTMRDHEIAMGIASG